MSLSRLSTIALFPLLAAVALAGCGGGPKMAQTAPNQPQAALPSGVRMVARFEPQAVAANPVVARLRAALGAGQSDMPLLGGLRAFGLDPQRQVSSGAWGLYDLDTARGVIVWGLALAGDLDEALTMAAIEASPDPRVRGAVDKRSFMGLSYYIVVRGSSNRQSETSIVFPMQGFMIASNNEALLQKSIAVWKGKADGVLTDKAFARVLASVPATAPVWVAGFAERTLTSISIKSADEGMFSAGDSLGEGVETFHASAELGADSVALKGEFQCENTESAAKQSANYKTLIKSRAGAYAQGGLGVGAILLGEKFQIEPQEKTVAATFQIGAAEMDKIAAAMERALASPPPGAPRLRPLPGAPRGLAPQTKPAEPQSPAQE